MSARLARFRLCPLAVACAIALTSPTSTAQTVGPSPPDILTTITVGSGTTTVVGQTNVTVGGAANASFVTGGTLSIQMGAPPRPGAIVFRSASGNGLFAQGGLIDVTSGVNVFTANGHAVVANGPLSTVNLVAGNLGTTGIGAGMVAIGGGVINARASDINNTASTASSSGHGAIAESGGVIHFVGLNRITTAGSNAVGLGASGTGSLITMTSPAQVTMIGTGEMGVYNYNGGQVALAAGSSIQLNGSGNVGFAVDRSVIATGTIGSGLTLRFNATPVAGQASGTGIVAMNGGNVTLDSVSIGGTGAGGGAWARPGSQITLTGNSVIDIQAATNPVFYTLTSGRLASANSSLGSTFSVTGGLPVFGLKADDGTILSTGSTISVAAADGVGAFAGLTGGTASLIDLQQTRITTTGANSFGLEAYSNGSITGNGSSVTTTGGGAAAFLYSYDNPPSSVSNSPASIALSNSVLSATGAGTTGIFSRNWSASKTATLALSGGSVHSEATAITAEGPLDVTATQGVTIAGDAALLYAYTYPGLPQKQATLVDLDASAATLDGLAEADTASIANIHLRDTSHWTGQANYISNVDIDATSTWTIPADSLLTQRLSNAGLVAFTVPTGDVYKNLYTHDYAGNGGTLAMNTYLGSDNSPSDKLIIRGGSATGTTAIQVTNAGGPGALTSGDGIPLVEVEGGGTTSATAFALAHRVAAGPFEYRLARGGGTGAVDDFWFLRTALDCSQASAPSPPCPGPNPEPSPPVPPTPPAPPPAPNPPAPPTPTDPAQPPDPTPPAPTPEPESGTPTPPVVPPPGPGLPEYRAEVSLYTALPALALRYGWATLGNLHERVGEEEQLRGRDDLRSDSTLNGAWVRAIGENGDARGDSRGIYGQGGPRYDYNLLALQAGLDVYAQEHENQQRDHVGLYGAQGRIQSDVRNFDHTYAGSDSVKATSLGVYWTHFWQEGAYLDAVWQGTWAKATARSVGDYTLQRHGFGWAASLEGGYPFHHDDQVIEPQAQVVYQTDDSGTTSDPAATVRFRNIESLAGRLGLRWANTWTLEPDRDGIRRLFTAWLRANLWREFRGQPVTEFSSLNGYVPFKADMKGNWWQLNAGMTWQLDSRFSVYANLGYQRGFNQPFDAWDGKVGLRWNW